MRFVFHPSENRLELLEFRIAVQGLEARIGKHLEKPGTSGFVAGFEFSECDIEIAESDVYSRSKGAEKKAFVAEPIQALEKGTGLGTASGTG